MMQRVTAIWLYLLFDWLSVVCCNLCVVVYQRFLVIMFEIQVCFCLHAEENSIIEAGRDRASGFLRDE